jgi:hypothetical protein
MKPFYKCNKTNNSTEHYGRCANFQAILDELDKSCKKQKTTTVFICENEKLLKSEAVQELTKQMR